MSVSSDGAPARGGELWRDRAFARWAGATLLVQMPGFMAPLAFVAIGLAATHTARTGGLMVAAEVVGLSLFAPFTGRLIDRVGPAPGIVASAGAGLVVYLAMAAATARGGDGGLLVLLAGLAGVAASSRAAGARTLLDDVVAARLHVAALRVNATLMEVMVLTAPFLVGAAAVLSAAAVPVAMAALLAAGGPLVAGLPRRPAAAAPSHGTATRRSFGPFLRSRPFWFWVAVQAAFGQVLGTVEPSALPWARQLGQGTFAAATALAVLSAAGIAASVAYLRVPPGRVRPPTEALVIVGLLVVGTVGFALSRTWIEGACALGLCGVATVPLNALTAHAAAHAMPAGRRAEGYAILGSVYAAGYALGSVTLAVLPLRATLLAGAAFGVAVLALTPLWRRV